MPKISEAAPYSAVTNAPARGRMLRDAHGSLHVNWQTRLSEGNANIHTGSYVIMQQDVWGSGSMRRRPCGLLERDLSRHSFDVMHPSRRQAPSQASGRLHMHFMALMP